MKKILAIILTAAMVLSSLSLFAFADEAAEPGDGFDFYSMTAHYKTAVVVGYKYVTKDDGIVMKDHDGNVVKDEDGNDVILDKAWIFDDPATEYIVPAVAFTSKDGTYTNLTLGYGDKALAKGKYQNQFYGVRSDAYKIDSSEISINDSYGYTNIGDNTAVSIISAATLFGVGEYYDDAGTPNPNFTRDANGYFLDQELDAEGNNLRIDVNSYVIDANGIWHSRDGHRIEPFVEVGEETYTWIDLNSRKEGGKADGRIIDYTTITNAILLEKGVIKALPEKYAFENTEADPDVDYDGDGKTGTSKDKKAFNNLVKEKTQWLESCSISMFTLDYIDANGDGKKTVDDLPEYNNPERVITQEDIMVRTDREGNKILVQGSPAIGNPVTKVEIEKLTIEIDALGTKLYDDVSADPQQKNVITVTSGDIIQNIEKAKAYVAEHPEKMYVDGIVIGTAKCVTTKTEAKAEGGNLPSTIKSVDVELTEGVQIPANATLFFNFKVETQQEKAEKKYIAKKDYKLLPINRGEINLDRLPDAPKDPDTDPEPKNGCKTMIGGGFAALALAAVAVIVIRKKED
ncbi:MAG: hypothetical protein IKX06_05430 [Clostridia bacterium]|nr:hypothetical protein [Clostridia bacterium]